MTEQQRAGCRHLGQPGLHQRTVVAVLEVVGAQQQSVVRLAALCQRARQRQTAAAFDHPALEAKARPSQGRSAAHRDGPGLALQPVEQQASHAGQVVDMLVAIDKVRPATAAVLEGLDLRRQFIGQRGQRQPAQVRGQQQTRQAGQTRPQCCERWAQRPAFGQVEVQPGLGLRAQARNRPGVLRPSRAVAQARKSPQPPSTHQTGDRRVNARAQAIVVGAQQQPSGFRHLARLARPRRPAPAPGQ